MFQSSRRFPKPALPALAFVFLAAVLLNAQVPADFGAYKAKDIRKSDVWINGGPLTLKSLKGKVVLIDFWAFDCEPCVEAMPHIVGLHAKYAKDGLVVIGVHTPRADYEKDVPKLREAITRMGIRFPVVVDNKQKIFEDYRCDLWPSQFIIDGNGVVRMSHGGLGRYDDMEELIRKLLASTER